MLSILIPTYNYNCTKLVQDLQKQAEILKIDYEIIVADDCSTDLSSIAQNQTIGNIHNCTFYREAENRGRAAIRNRLAAKSSKRYLLFIDCDAEIDSPYFLTRYIDAIDEHTTVVCGGLKHVTHLPSPQVSLRFKYEKKADKNRSAHQRTTRPYNNFSSFCFLIERTLFFSIRFNEKCTQYGYEDALLGVELMKKRVKILHIDNPLIHCGLDTNKQFLEKTELALQTLLGLGEEMQQHATIAQYAAKIRSWKIDGVVRGVFKLFNSPIRKNLMSKRASLYLFSFYKLGFYLQLQKHYPYLGK